MTDEKRIDGQAIAKKILDELTQDVETLKKAKKITPRMTVFLVGDNPASRSYIAQKQKAGQAIGAEVNLIELPVTITEKELRDQIKKANDDSTVHGIIIQRPLPRETQVPPETLDKIALPKEIDGFVPNSPYTAPVALAVIAILEDIFYKHFNTPELDLITWLRPQTIVVIGKGVTAGKPTADIFAKLSVPVIVIDRSTPNPDEILQKATIIVSCVGQPRYVKKSAISDGVILISVGVSRMDGKLAGDYDVEEIQKKAQFYTPTPGGVGPINVACLMQNLVKACKIQIDV